jgi:putative CocE/NonD family hydrolase
MDFGPESLLDLRQEELAWFESELTPRSNPDAIEPAVRVFVMGRNAWRTGSTWPFPETEYRNLYLDSAPATADDGWRKGRLVWQRRGEGSAHTYVHDPSDPVPTVGGITCCSEDVTPVTMGPRDQRGLLSRSDVLAYATEPMTEPVEIAGPVRLKLHASTTAVDTDFCGKLVDIYPDGRVINIAEGILRGSKRDSWEHTTLLDPGNPYLFDIDFWSTANCFLPGHRIGLIVMSSNFPQFDRNLGKGEPFGYGVGMVAARQEVYLQGAKASHLVLPIVPLSA